MIDHAAVATDKGRVAWWLKVKAEQPADTVDFRTLVVYMRSDKGLGEPEERLRLLLKQLSYDASHSSLLQRLFEGEEPR